MVCTFEHRDPFGEIFPGSKVKKSFPTMEVTKFFDIIDFLREKDILFLIKEEILPRANMILNKLFQFTLQ